MDAGRCRRRRWPGGQDFFFLVNPHRTCDDQVNCLVRNLVAFAFFATAFPDPLANLVRWLCWTESFTQHSFEDCLVIIRLHCEEREQVAVTGGDGFFVCGSLLPQPFDDLLNEE